ncbi:MAG: hypothetical protein DMG39_25800 [Acidobacteria bacterium]|nr:MAG: hypothetical protein DMG39_25800 [Acidobacteriota bacterium]
MKISSLFLGAGLLLAVCGCTNAATPQAATDQAALMGKASIVFSGTVSQLAATSFADVPKSTQTIVVHVDSIVKKPAAVSLKRGDSVTVEVKDASAFQEGTQATFYTDGWIFGSGVAVKELGHVMGAAVGPVHVTTAGQNPQGTPEQISDQELRERMNTSDYVVVGRVTDVRKWNAPKSKSGAPLHVTEHDADWHEAVVEVQSVLKGGKVKGNKVIVRFPSRNDVAWVRSPKFTKNQRGIFCLNRGQTSGAPTTTVSGQQGNVYTCLGHGDALPMSEEARVRALLKNP